MFDGKPTASDPDVMLCPGLLNTATAADLSRRRRTAVAVGALLQWGAVRWMAAKSRAASLSEDYARLVASPSLLAPAYAAATTCDLPGLTAHGAPACRPS